ncbi:hypothetical protein DSECCO2_157260 [anaerobic digester metagenome]
MQKSKFITSEEVANELGVSKSFAYKVVRQLNDELRHKGFMTVSGKVSRLYYEEKFYGLREGQNVSVQG